MSDHWHLSLIPRLPCSGIQTLLIVTEVSVVLMAVTHLLQWKTACMTFDLILNCKMECNGGGLEKHLQELPWTFGVWHSTFYCWVALYTPSLSCQLSRQQKKYKHQSSSTVPYSGKLLREKTWWKFFVCGFVCVFNLDWLLDGAIKRRPPSNFAEKLLQIATKPSKFTKVFSLESFPLYGI